MNDNFSTIIKSKTKVFHWSISIFVFTIPVSSLISVKLLLVTLLISFFVPKRVDFSVHFFRQTWSEFLYFLIILIGG